MLFTEPGFLFLFLPLVLGIYLVLPRSLRNAWLLVASLFFYGAGEKIGIVLLLVGEIAFNFVVGRHLSRQQSPNARRRWLIFGLCGNLVPLAVFKYAEFLILNLNAVLASLHLAVPQPHIHLPMGISFFTFHGLSYLIDVYRGAFLAMESPIDFGLYITFFPQLIAGPIIRYGRIAAQFSQRQLTRAGFAEGVRRFIVGLGKKMILANTAALVADHAFKLRLTDLSCRTAWLGISAYALQIYFDFSGYSDMAIGLGRMFGFVFPENFNYPYIATSITDFWRRWHMTLSNWFRDYLYIPMGGNRVPPWRVYLNLLIVFFLCGLWHGASWNFVIWGLFHGAFLIIERIASPNIAATIPRPIKHIYLLLAVMIGWVFFRAETLPQALGFLQAMAGLGPKVSVELQLPHGAFVAMILALAAATIGCMPVFPWVAGQVRNLRDRSKPALGSAFNFLMHAGELGGMAAVLLLSSALSAAGTYNPFIYFRF